MGHQIYANGEMRDGVCFTQGAWQVIEWCERFTPAPRPARDASDHEWWMWADEHAGLSQASAEAVARADREVPMEFEAAERLGFLTAKDHRSGRLLDERHFREVRDFLRRAAQNNSGISGSY